MERLLVPTLDVLQRATAAEEALLGAGCPAPDDFSAHIV